MAHRKEVMGMEKKIECRRLALRAADQEGGGEDLHVEGYAAVFNEKTLLWESPYSGIKYYEVIDRNAVDANTDMSDVILRYNHSDAALILARTSNGSMKIAADERGIKVEADIAPTTAGKDIYQLIKRGDINKMSFAFTVDKDDWENDSAAKEQTRTIKHIDMIVDASPVDFPAYDGTSIAARGHDGIIEELKRHEQDAALREKLIVETYL